MVDEWNVVNVPIFSGKNIGLSTDCFFSKSKLDSVEIVMGFIRVCFIRPTFRPVRR